MNKNQIQQHKKTMYAFPSVHQKEKSLNDKEKKREKEKEGVSERSNLASPKQNQKVIVKQKKKKIKMPSFSWNAWTSEGLL